jgi:hypothetical protein
MTDLTLDKNLDLLIQNGDLLFCNDTDTDFQDLNILLNLNTGDSKQFPLLGTNMITAKNGDYQSLISTLYTQMDIAGLPVKKISQTNDNKLKILLEDNYTFVDLSIL